VFDAHQPHTMTPSQAVFWVEARRNRRPSGWLRSPEPKLERIVGLSWVLKSTKSFGGFSPSNPCNLTDCFIRNTA